MTALISPVNASPKLTVVGAFPNQQATGVGVSEKTGRFFVNFPSWSDDYQFAVARLGKDGKLTPYPDDAWNAKKGVPAKRFVCVQSVVVGDQDHLWVFDPASPNQEGVVAGAAKLLDIDLVTNKVVRTISFSEQVAPKKSYLNDLRYDTANRTSYITESGVGAIVVVNLGTGNPALSYGGTTPRRPNPRRTW